MSTLLLRLAGPMQSWGTQSRFSIRDTGLEPSKSGVIGLLCAALGRPRSEPVADLAGLAMGVRVDRGGVLKMDYQTAGGTHLRGDMYGVAKASGGRPDTVQSNRYYLADASFLVGLESTDNEALLRELDAALAEPVWQLFLGRKSYVPGVPVRLPDEPPEGPGLRDLPLKQALREYPWPVGMPNAIRDRPQRVRLVLEGTESGAELRRDVPISFDTRQFAVRTVQTIWIDHPEEGHSDVSVTADPQST